MSRRWHLQHHWCVWFHQNHWPDANPIHLGKKRSVLSKQNITYEWISQAKHQYLYTFTMNIGISPVSKSKNKKSYCSQYSQSSSADISLMYSTTAKVLAIHATLQKDDCSSSRFLVLLCPWVNVKVIQTLSHCTAQLCLSSDGNWKKLVDKCPNKPMLLGLVVLIVVIAVWFSPFHIDCTTYI